MVSTDGEASAVSFHSKEAKSLYLKLMQEQNELEIANSRLDQLRQEYHKANTNERKQMKNEKGLEFKATPDYPSAAISITRIR